MQSADNSELGLFFTRLRCPLRCLRLRNSEINDELALGNMALLWKSHRNVLSFVDGFLHEVFYHHLFVRSTVAIRRLPVMGCVATPWMSAEQPWLFLFFSFFPSSCLPISTYVHVCRPRTTIYSESKEGVYTIMVIPSMSRCRDFRLFEQTGQQYSWVNILYYSMCCVRWWWDG